MLICDIASRRLTFPYGKYNKIPPDSVSPFFLKETIPLPLSLSSSNRLAILVLAFFSFNGLVLASLSIMDLP